MACAAAVFPKATEAAANPRAIPDLRVTLCIVISPFKEPSVRLLQKRVYPGEATPGGLAWHHDRTRRLGLDTAMLRWGRMPLHIASALGPPAHRLTQCVGGERVEGVAD